MEIARKNGMLHLNGLTDPGIARAGISRPVIKIADKDRTWFWFEFIQNRLYRLQ